VELVSTSGSPITKLGVHNELGAQIGWGLLLETRQKLKYLNTYMAASSPKITLLGEVFESVAVDK